MNTKITVKIALRFVLMLFSYAKSLTVFMFSLVLTNTVLTYTVPIFTEHIVDNLLVTGSPSISKGLVIGYVVILLISVLSTNLERFIAIKHGELVANRFRNVFFHTVLKKDFVQFHQNSYGDVETAMTSCIDDINDAAYCFVETLIVYPIGIFLGISYISKISFGLLVIILAQLLLNYLIMHHGSMMRNEVQKENYRVQSNYFSVLSGLYHAYENIRMLFLLTRSDEKHQKESFCFARSNIKLARINFLNISMLLELTSAIVNIATIFVFFLLVQEGTSSVGAYLAFVSIKEAISGSFNGFIKLKANKATFDAALEQINALEPLENLLQQRGVVAEKTSEKPNSIRLSQVAYTYPASKQQFLFDFTFQRSNCYLMLGENGVGKTTFVRLLTNLLTCDANINTGNSVVKVLPQNIQLFDENILDILIDENTAFSEVAAVRLGVLELIKNIQKKQTGTDAVVCSLSGGEKKKILLSLLLGQKSDILILDEPFAEIDMWSKNVLAEIIRDNVKDRILILISHEIPPALKDCTTVIHLEKNDGISRFS